MSLWIADTGPLVACLAARDTMHGWAVEQLRVAPPQVVACEAVFTELLFLLKRAGHSTEPAFDLVETGFLRLEFSFAAERAAVRKLMRRYADQPMSFADACLVRLAELHPGAPIWTLDRDFRVYRLHGRQSLPLIAPF